MEDIGFLWTFQESVDELKQKLQYVTFELEITRKEAKEETKKKNEQFKQLLELLQTAYKERDEANAQLKKLQEFMSFTKPTFDSLIPTPAPLSPDSPLFTNYSARANSGLTESNSLSVETTSNNNNNKNPQIQSKSHSPDSSPVVDSLSYHPAATSPDSSHIFLSGNSLVTPTVKTTPILSPPTKKLDHESMLIENLARGRPLPQKGRLLLAVMEAGPLLQTLLVAGSLPQWRNPPGSTAHQIPPVNIRGCDRSFGDLVCKSVSDATCSVARLGNSSVYCQSSGGSLGVYPNPMIDYDSGSSEPCLLGGRMMSSAVNLDCQIPKRQRVL